MRQRKFNVYKDLSSSNHKQQPNKHTVVQVEKQTRGRGSSHVLKDVSSCDHNQGDSSKTR
ncbi:hypothetical protein WMY93_014884 [Mugilogobius chulae]|uniref:Uncharacterized protein n=1 Tax=Mugilogobius chulae TaxID=88201 RepID=A0AAW0P019_9GOBI